jgi:3-deoxy-D-manno-octulosonic-acid transferase
VFFLYNLLLTLFAPIWAPAVYLKARKRKEQPNWQERAGNYSIPRDRTKRRIWFHAVSVGEVVAGSTILREVRKLAPEFEIVLSTTTSSGHKTATELEPGVYDHLVYFPLDVARFQLAALLKVQPQAVVVFETELWMNFFHIAKVMNVRTLMVNGRISDRSFPRSKKLAFFYRTLLKNVDRCLMQSDVDAERIRALGATSAEVMGNCKFDQALEGLAADADRWRSELGLGSDKPVIVVGSTRGEEEEELLFGAFAAIGWDRMQIVHAPRHLERVDAIAERVKTLTGAVARRSLGQTGPYQIIDTYGELAEIYAIADIAIVGGGFANLGGQNILQPLAHGKPVIHGTHMQNFRDVVALSTRSGASQSAATAEELAMALDALLGDKTKREQMGKAAQELIRSNAGASRRFAEAIVGEARREAV